MSDIFWLIGMCLLFVIVGAMFISWVGALVMFVFFFIALIGVMMT